MDTREIIKEKASALVAELMRTETPEGSVDQLVKNEAITKEELGDIMRGALVPNKTSVASLKIVRNESRIDYKLKGGGKDVLEMIVGTAKNNKQFHDLMMMVAGLLLDVPPEEMFQIEKKGQ